MITGYLLLVGVTGTALSATPDCTASPSLTGSQSEQIELLMDVAKACTQQGNLDQAVLLFGQVIEKDPNNATAYLDRGTVYAKKGEVRAGLGLQSRDHAKT